MLIKLNHIIIFALIAFYLGIFLYPIYIKFLKKIKNITLIVSNPSIELWFLLHYKNQTAALTGRDCIRELNNRNRNNYKKGGFLSAFL